MGSNARSAFALLGAMAFVRCAPVYEVQDIEPPSAGAGGAVQSTPELPQDAGAGDPGQPSALGDAGTGDAGDAGGSTTPTILCSAAPAAQKTWEESNGLSGPTFSGSPGVSRAWASGTYVSATHSVQFSVPSDVTGAARYSRDTFVFSAAGRKRVASAWVRADTLPGETIAIALTAQVDSSNTQAFDVTMTNSELRVREATAGVTSSSAVKLVALVGTGFHRITVATDRMRARVEVTLDGNLVLTKAMDSVAVPLSESVVVGPHVYAGPTGATLMYFDDFVVCGE